MFIRENFPTAINCLIDGFNLFGCFAPWPIESIISDIREISVLRWMNNSGGMTRQCLGLFRARWRRQSVGRFHDRLIDGGGRDDLWSSHDGLGGTRGGKIICQGSRNVYDPVRIMVGFFIFIHPPISNAFGRFLKCLIWSYRIVINYWAPWF